MRSIFPTRSRPAILLRATAATVLLMAMCAGFAAQGPTAGAKSRYTVKTIKLAKGVQLLEVHDSKGPNRIRVIRMDPRIATLDVGDAGPTWPAYAPTSSIAKAHHAVAAINGDFAKDGHPWHPYMEDGMPGTTGFNVGSGFSTQASGRNSYVGRGPIHSSASDLSHGTHLKIGVWNEKIKKSDELAAYTYQGGSAEHAPKGACTARLIPGGEQKWGPGKKSIRRTYHVDSQKCQTDPLTFGSDRNAVILSSKTKTGKAANWLSKLTAGNDVRLEWDIPGRSDVLDQQSGVPLLQHGKIVAPGSCASYYCGLNPRTGIGYLKNGNVVLVTVDGRQHSSKGMTLPEFAKVFEWLGAQWAVNSRRRRIDHDDRQAQGQVQGDERPEQQGPQAATHRRRLPGADRQGPGRAEDARPLAVRDAARLGHGTGCLRRSERREAGAAGGAARSGLDRRAAGRAARTRLKRSSPAWQGILPDDHRQLTLTATRLVN